MTIAINDVMSNGPRDKAINFKNPFDLNFQRWKIVNYYSGSMAQWLKITQNVAFEFLNFDIFHQIDRSSKTNF